MLKIEIDEHSGFCFGVTTAIKKAEEELSRGSTLYCLGDIVHNSIECDRLKRIGLITIDRENIQPCFQCRRQDARSRDRNGSRAQSSF